MKKKHSTKLLKPRGKISREKPGSKSIRTHRPSGKAPWTPKAPAAPAALPTKVNAAEKRKAEAKAALPPLVQSLADTVRVCQSFELPVFKTVDGEVFTVRPSVQWTTDTGKFEVAGYFPFYFRDGRSYRQALTTREGYEYPPKQDDLFVSPQAAIDAWSAANKADKDRPDSTQMLRHPLFKPNEQGKPDKQEEEDSDE